MSLQNQQNQKMTSTNQMKTTECKELKNEKASLLEDALGNDYISSLIYDKPTNLQLILATRLFKSLISSQGVNSDQALEWASLGFAFKEIEENNLLVGILYESIPKGNGFYAFKFIKKVQNGENIRSTGTSECILQAPHKPSDLLTDAIACKLFLEGDFSAAAWSTTHRKNVDMARETDSYFNAFTEAVAISYKSIKLIQLHAFDSSKHNLDCDLILSSTTMTCTKLYEDIANSLKKEFENECFKICQYPKDITILGGLKNINAKVFYNFNPESSFIHLETSMKMREALMNSQSLRNKFAKCFVCNN